MPFFRCIQRFLQITVLTSNAECGSRRTSDSLCTSRKHRLRKAVFESLQTPEEISAGHQLVTTEKPSLFNTRGLCVSVGPGEPQSDHGEDRIRGKLPEPEADIADPIFEETMPTLFS